MRVVSKDFRVFFKWEFEEKFEDIKCVN